MESKLRKKRLAAGYKTLDAVKEKTGIAMSTLSNIETGKNSPRISTLRVLAELYGCKIGDLL